MAALLLSAETQGVIVGLRSLIGTVVFFVSFALLNFLSFLNFFSFFGLFIEFAGFLVCFSGRFRVWQVLQVFDVDVAAEFFDAAAVLLADGLRLRRELLRLIIIFLFISSQ